MKNPGVPVSQLLDISWTLSGNGQTPGQYLYDPTEACAHSEQQAQAALARLAGLPLTEAMAFRAKLRRTTKSSRRAFWGAKDQCVLCVTLQRLAR
jgi:hypothetical protein